MLLLIDFSAQMVEELECEEFFLSRVEKKHERNKILQFVEVGDETFFFAVSPGQLEDHPWLKVLIGECNGVLREMTWQEKEFTERFDD